LETVLWYQKSAHGNGASCGKAEGASQIALKAQASDLPTVGQNVFATDDVHTMHLARDLLTVINE